MADLYTKKEVCEARKAFRKFARSKSADLLTAGDQNPKTAKDKRFFVSIMHFAPADLSGFEVCAMRSIGCTLGCLHTAGNKMYLKPKTIARINRTRFWFLHPEQFKALLWGEIAAHVRKAKRLGKRAAIRLNGTSDIVWEKKFPELFKAFPRLTFWDYTKIPNRKTPRNYSLTFSRSEDNEARALGELKRGNNVAVVMSGCGISAHPRPLPKKWRGFRVVDGDKTDLRFLDPRGVVVALRAKGDARGDLTGFVLNPFTPLTIGAA